MPQNLTYQMEQRSRIVFVDGDCPLCNRSSLMILQNDTSGTLLIASLHSRIGQEAGQAVGQDLQDFDTAIFLDRGVFYKKSSAILHIGLYCPFALRLLASIALFIPVFLRDKVYDAVARNRQGLNRGIA